MNKEDFKNIINNTIIDKIFLAKSLLVLLGIYIFIIFSNIYLSNSIYSKILDNIQNKEVLVIDHNGNKTFEQIGNINLDIVSLFAKQSIRRILELSYENKFALFYARDFVSKDIYEQLNEKYNKMEDQLKIENGFYSVNITKLELKNIDKIKQEYTFYIETDLTYFYDGGDKKQTKSLEIKITQGKEIENNYFGLVISKLNEVTIIKNK